MKISKEKFKKVKEDAKKFYLKIGEVKCPYLKQKVHFNRKGFEHITTDGWNRGRTIREQSIRLKLLSKTVGVIEKSHTLQEYDERKIFVRQNINSRWEKRLKRVQYFAFISTYPSDGVRLKVVIEKIEGASPVFLSVYPFWKVKNDINGNRRKVFYSGNMSGK
ncbi:hypothetical protein ACFL05_00950 [Patescibacteria group bacterium]